MSQRGQFLLSLDTRARRLLAEAKAVDPRSPFVSLALADTDRAEGKLDAALSQYRAVVAAHGEDTAALRVAYWSMAQIHGERREWALQEAAYLNVLRLEPDSAWAKINYAGALLASGKYDQAIEYATAALKQMDFGVGRLVLAQAYFRKGWQLTASESTSSSRPEPTWRPRPRARGTGKRRSTS